MRRARLAVDMADPRWLRPGQTIEVEVDTNDVSIFEPELNVNLRLALIVHHGAEFVVYRAQDDPLPWNNIFAVTVARLTAGNWAEAVRSGFSGGVIEAVGKAVIELLPETLA